MDETYDVVPAIFRLEGTDTDSKYVPVCLLPDVGDEATVALPEVPSLLACALPSYDCSLGHHGSVRTSPTRYSEEEFVNDADYSASLEHAWALLLSFRTHTTDGLVSLRSISFCVVGVGCA